VTGRGGGGRGGGGMAEWLPGCCLAVHATVLHVLYGLPGCWHVDGTEWAGDPGRS
jgi:hypothetical protein